MSEVIQNPVPKNVIRLVSSKPNKTKKQSGDLDLEIHYALMAIHNISKESLKQQLTAIIADELRVRVAADLRRLGV